MDLGFKDRVALITGTASQIGMGKEIALTLALKADISNKAEVDDMVKTAFKEFGRIDILVNNAGSISSLKPFVEQTDEESQKDMDINLYGAVHCCQAVATVAASSLATVLDLPELSLTVMYRASDELPPSPMPWKYTHRESAPWAVRSSAGLKVRSASE